METTINVLSPYLLFQAFTLCAAEQAAIIANFAFPTRGVYWRAEGGGGYFYRDQQGSTFPTRGVFLVEGGCFIKRYGGGGGNYYREKPGSTFPPGVFS